MTRVAFLGTGAMGAPMERNPRRSRARGSGLRADALRRAQTGEAVHGTLRPGLLWAQMGTIGIDWTQRLADLARPAGVDFLDAPVMGSTPAAEAGELIVFASGSNEAIDRAEPVFSVVAKQTHRVGDVGAAARPGADRGWFRRLDLRSDEGQEDAHARLGAAVKLALGRKDVALVLEARLEPVSTWRWRRPSSRRWTGRSTAATATAIRRP